MRSLMWTCAYQLSSRPCDIHAWGSVDDGSVVPEDAIEHRMELGETDPQLRSDRLPALALSDGRISPTDISLPPSGAQRSTPSDVLDAERPVAVGGSISASSVSSLPKPTRGASNEASRTFFTGFFGKSLKLVVAC